MLNDYKPTHDPNIDTLQVQYLLGGSAFLAALFPYRYEITEVRPLFSNLFRLQDAKLITGYRCYGPSRYGWKA